MSKLTQFDGHGYFMNDDRASGGTKTEDDILNCNHCQKSMKKTMWKMRGGKCFVCDGFLCYDCYSRTRQFGCEVYERQLVQAVDAHYRREQNRKVMGV